MTHLVLQTLQDLLSLEHCSYWTRMHSLTIHSSSLVLFLVFFSSPLLLWFLFQMQKDVQLQMSLCEKLEECLGDTRHDPLTTDSTQTSTRLALESLLQKNPAQTSFSRFFSPSLLYRNVVCVFPSSLSLSFSPSHMLCFYCMEDVMESHS